MLAIIISFLLAINLFNHPVYASGNIFGLHLTQPQDIYSAKTIINSSNGDWGWATIVLRTDQLDKQTWQNFFDDCRKFHIIPIIRIATIMEKDYWKIPSLPDIDNLANFLNSLNWPTEQQHVILFNEINHASEWGGEVNIKNFTDTSIYAAQKFKSLNSNFIILSSALDLAAPEKMPKYKSAENVYKEIASYKPEYFDLIDAIASHSYPNHGYIGTPSDTGQHSIRGYQWELNYLKQLNIQKQYPVYITETGWPHQEGETKERNFYTTKTTAEFLKKAYGIWEKDENIVAITPFTYNFPNQPFEHFSWLDKNENIYPEYQQLIEMPKLKNTPKQITQYETLDIKLPFIIFSNTDYSGTITLKNTGQSIWGETDFCLMPQITQNVELDAICTGKDPVLPGHNKTFDFKFKILSDSNHYGKTYISWTNLPNFEIKPLNNNATIYSPKTNTFDKLLHFFHDSINAIFSKN